MERVAAFWDRIAEKYAADPVKDLAAYEDTLERVRAVLTPQTRVLEIGCGTGSTAILLAPGSGRFLATDVSGEMLRIAQGKSDGVANLSYEQALAQEAGHGQSFDVVLAFSLLHLVEDLPSVLRHIRSRLEPGGIFISKTACLGTAPWFRPIIFVMRLLGKAPPVLHLTPKRLRADIEAAGFEIMETQDQRGEVLRHYVKARAI